MSLWLKILVALGLRERPRRSQLTMWTYDEKSIPSIAENKKLRKLLQVDDVWHTLFTDSLGRKVHYEFHWWGPDDGWHLHNWKIEEANEPKDG